MALGWLKNSKLTNMRIREDRRPIYTFGYIDESGTSERYFGAGLLLSGPAVSGVHDRRLNEHIRQLKVRSGIKLCGDVGWKKVPSKEGMYLDLYTRYIDGFFRQPDLSFHCIVVDTQRYPLNGREYFHGSKDAGIDAFCFHLVRGRVLKPRAVSRHLVLRLDRRNRPKKQALALLRSRLREAALRYGGPNPPAVKLRSITGARHPLVQVTDVLLGAVTASLNGKTRNRCKLGLIERLGERLGRAPGAPTPPWERKFNVWHFEADPPESENGRAT